MRVTRGLFFILFFLLSQTNGFSQKGNQLALQMLTDHVFNLSEVMLHDVANPPAASRVYAYAMLGAYEAILYGKHPLLNINTQLKVNPGIQPTPLPENFNAAFSANYALLEVGRQLMPSGYLLEEKKKDLVSHFRSKKMMDEKNLEEHIRYATEIARQVVKYAKMDGYNRLSTYIHYTPSKVEGHWYPTPPEYMGAVEPQWKTIRPFFMDTASQFSPRAPVAFSRDSTSAFYTLMREVYTIGNGLTEAQRKIASFWDCNPFAVTYSGHMAIGLKKISPGGHWMGITGIACKKADIPLDSAILIHTMVALTLHDAFISCWQEKYYSDRIRPETAINKLINASWRPLLQTPPFPEYTSGHSVASSSVAVVLTHLLGDHFKFTDTSEVYFGLPERSFDSFYQAANEAALSRLYGGIHFRDACDEGVIQGKKIGALAIEKLTIIR